MISKSAAALFLRQSGSAQTKYAALTVAHQRNFAGGGPKKPSMPASNTDFDVVFVGNIIFYKFPIFISFMVDADECYRWNERYCSC